MLVLVVMLFLVNNVLSKVAKKELKLLENTKAITMESLLKSILNFSKCNIFCFWQVRTLFTGF
jgi:hypothetical protein